MSNVIEYTLKFDSNGNAVIDKITGSASKLQNNLSKTQNVCDRFGASFLKWNAINDAINNVGNGFKSLMTPGLNLESSMADLHAITGLTGDKLKEIEGYARDAAKTFGGSAAQGVESYKLILSQLGPSIADTPAALNAMGNSVNILSKSMGGDTVAATEVLTTAMNQFQVSLDDPIAASKTMSDMMNTMAAAAKEGSAELPAIKAALEQSGMAAKMAGVSFSEVNAAIQVLDKAGKKGAEGGVAIRNVLAIMSQGRFMPKEAQDALRSAGVDIEKLGDNSLSFSQRLSMLKPVIGDSAVMTKLFGMENQNAARALISGTDQINTYNTAIQGTTSAQDQAAIVMASTAEKMKRMQAQVEDLKIGMFNLTGAAYPYLDVTVQTISTISDLVPAFMMMTDVIGFLTNAEKMNALWTRVSGIARTTWSTISGTAVVTWGLLSAAATWAWSTAQWALNAAFIASPIGWIVLGVGVLIAVIIVAWNKFEKFRAVILTVWDTIKGFGNILKEAIIDRIKSLLSGIGFIGKAIYQLFTGHFSDAWQSAKQGIVDLSGYEAVKKAVTNAGKVVGDIGANYDQNLANERAKGAASAPAAQPAYSPYVSSQVMQPQAAQGFGIPGATDTYNPGGIAPPSLPGAVQDTKKTTTSDSTKKTTEAIATGGTKTTNVTITLKDLVGTINFNSSTGSFKENAQQLKELVLDELTRVLSMAQGQIA